MQFVTNPSDAVVSPQIDRAEWKRLRGPRLGSTDAPAIFDKSSFSTAGLVWDRIVLGEWAPEPDELPGDLRRGNRQEANALERFQEVTGLFAEPLPMIEHPEEPRIVTDVDALVHNPTATGDPWPAAILDHPLWAAVAECEGDGVLEIKCPRIAKFYQYKELGLPEEYVVQAQHHMMVTGKTWGFFAFYTPEYDEVIAFPIVRDEGFSAFLFKAECSWLAAYVDKRRRPTKKAPPPPVWPTRVPGEATIRDDEEWLEIAERLTYRHYDLVEAQEGYEQTEAELLALLPAIDAEAEENGTGPELHLAGGGVTVKRRSTAQQNRIDWSAFDSARKLALMSDDPAAELLKLDPEDFRALTKSSIKVDVKVFGPNPHEVQKI